MAQFPEEQSADGNFERQEDAFRKWVQPDGEFPAAVGRYHLVISLACPWACRTLIVRNLLGLQDVIGVTEVDPVRDERGWAFRNGDGFSGDLVNGFQFLAEVYQASDPDFKGRVTVPVLWDKVRREIVNNSEDDICRMMQGAFAGMSANGEPPDLFPSDLAAEQAALSEYVYENVNNGVYRAGFASKQESYERAVMRVFSALDELEERLRDQPFLLGARPVETDWRLFCTLIRFDAVYHGHFKCNIRRIVDYPRFREYLTTLYHWPGIAETVNFDHIKRHYYMTHDDINPTRIVPVGPDLGWLVDRA